MENLNSGTPFCPIANSKGTRFKPQAGKAKMQKDGEKTLQLNCCMFAHDIIGTSDMTGCLTFETSRPCNQIESTLSAGGLAESVSAVTTGSKNSLLNALGWL